MTSRFWLFVVPKPFRSCRLPSENEEFADDGVELS